MSSGAPRAWQTRAQTELADWREGSFLISATPGAGKTRPALLFARGQFVARQLAGLVVVCPTAPLTRQWARAGHEVGLSLLPDAEGPVAPAGFHGVVVTYARVARDPQPWARIHPQTLVVADEAHHLGEELTWGQGFPGVLSRTAMAAPVGHAVSLRQDEHPWRAVLRSGRGDSRRQLLLRRGGARRRVPPDGVRPVRRRLRLAS
jgi:hypothetical protein